MGKTDICSCKECLCLPNKKCIGTQNNLCFPDCFCPDPTMQDDNCHCLSCLCNPCLLKEKSKNDTEGATSDQLPENCICEKCECDGNCGKPNCSCPLCNCITSINKAKTTLDTACKKEDCTCQTCNCPVEDLKAKGDEPINPQKSPGGEKEGAVSPKQTENKTLQTNHKLGCICKDCLCYECFGKQKEKVADSKQTQQSNVLSPVYVKPGCICKDCICYDCPGGKKKDVIDTRPPIGLDKIIEVFPSKNINESTVIESSATIDLSKVDPKNLPTTCICPKCKCDTRNVTLCGECGCINCTCSGNANNKNEKHSNTCTCPKCLCKSCEFLEQGTDTCICVICNCEDCNHKLETKMNNLKKEEVGDKARQYKCICDICKCSVSIIKNKSRGINVNCICPMCVCENIAKKYEKIDKTEQHKCPCSTCDCQDCTTIKQENIRHSEGCTCEQCLCKQCKFNLFSGKSNKCTCTVCTCEECMKKEGGDKTGQIKVCTCEICNCSCSNIKKEEFATNDNCCCIACTCDECFKNYGGGENPEQIKRCLCDYCVCIDCQIKNENFINSSHPDGCTCNQCLCKICYLNKSTEKCLCPVCVCSETDKEELKNSENKKCYCFTCVCDKCVGTEVINEKLEQNKDCNCNKCDCQECLAKIEGPKNEEMQHHESCTCEKCLCKERVLKTLSLGGTNKTCTCIICYCDECIGKEGTKENKGNKAVIENTLPERHGDKDNKPIFNDCNCDQNENEGPGDNCVCLDCTIIKVGNHSDDCMCVECTCKQCELKNVGNIAQCICNTCECPECSLIKGKFNLNDKSVGDNTKLNECICSKCSCENCKSIFKDKSTTKITSAVEKRGRSAPPINKKEGECNCSKSSCLICQNRKQNLSTRNNDDNQKMLFEVPPRKPCDCIVCEYKISLKDPTKSNNNDKVNIPDKQNLSTQNNDNVPLFEVPLRTQCNCIVCECETCPKDATNFKNNDKENIPKKFEDCRCDIQDNYQYSESKINTPQNINSKFQVCECLKSSININDSQQNSKVDVIKSRIIECEDEISKMSNKVLKENLIQNKKECCQCKLEINKIRKILENFQCNSTTSMKKPKDTMSNLKTALCELEENCKIKDIIIELMTNELKLRAGESFVQDLINKESLNREISKNKCSDENYENIKKRQKEKKRSSSQMQMNLTSFEIIDIRRCTTDSIIVKWQLPKSNKIKGYEILVNGLKKCTISDPEKTSTVLNDVDLTSEVEIYIYALCRKGRCEPPAIAIYNICK